MKRQAGKKRYDGYGDRQLSDKAAAHKAMAEDEEIEDELAFDSEDEKMFGQFFSKSEAAPKKGKKAGKNKADAIDKEFSKLHGEDFDEPHGGDFSDDSRDAMDLSELLDSKDERRESRKKRRDGRQSVPKNKFAEAETMFASGTGGISLKDLIGASAAPLPDAEADGASPKGKKKKAKPTVTDEVKTRLETAVSNRKLIARPVEAYEKEKSDRATTREEVGKGMKKWAGFLREQKRAKTLSFPLHKPDSTPTPGSLGAMATSVTPQTAAEQTMEDMLIQSGLKKDPNATKHASDGYQPLPEDSGEAPDTASAPDQSYVAKLKAMLSYEVAKRKRFNKIKSKTYRRILRREKDRENEKRQRALELLNPDAARKRLQAKMEKARAEERITMKHKNTSKWVKHARKYAKVDDETRDAMHEQHALHAKLMEKMTEDADAEITAVAGEETSSEEGERRVDELLSGANAKSVLWGDADAGEEEAELGPDATPIEKARKDLNKMGFMKSAKARHAKEMEANVAELQEDMERFRKGLPPIHDPGFDIVDDEEKALDAEVKAADRADMGLEPTPASAMKKRKKEVVVKPPVEKRSDGRITFNTSEKADAIVQLSSKGLQRREGDEVTADTAEADRNALRERLSQEAREMFGLAPKSTPKAKASEEGAVAETAKEGGKRPRDGAGSAPGSKVRKVGAQTVPKKTDAERDYLISRAFARDEIDEDFLKSKESQVETVMKPEDKNAALPGWGEWGGERKTLNFRHQKKVAKLDAARAVERSALMGARADSHLKNVIINHDVDLIPSQYGLHMVPRPFANAQEFERSMRHPVGPEWNTANSYKDTVQPRVQTQRGTIIDPVDNTVKGRKAPKTTRKKTGTKKAVKA